jgi:ornithine cyclodeaminase
MNVRFLSGADVRRLLPMAECIDIMAEALATLQRGDAVLPLRSAVWLPDRSGLLGLMPAYLGGARSGLGLKAVSIMPGNHATGRDSHQGLVLLFESRFGSPVAILDASSITEIRTAAVSGLATRILAREDASALAILGSGVQARSHLAAMMAVRTFERVRVWSRSEEHALRFARVEGERWGRPVEVRRSAEDAVRGAHVICTTTAAREPVLAGAWLAPGAHVNAVGACFAGARELDTAAVARARVFVDRLESARAEAGDLLIPMAEGAIGESHVAGELGDLLLGRVEGRRTADEITLFESLGIAVEDVAVARYLFDKAEAAGAGGTLDVEGGGAAPA